MTRAEPDPNFCDHCMQAISGRRLALGDVNGRAEREFLEAAEMEHRARSGYEMRWPQDSQGDE